MLKKGPVSTGFQPPPRKRVDFEENRDGEYTQTIPDPSAPSKQKTMAADRRKVMIREVLKLASWA
jgi:hypothetical protein